MAHLGNLISVSGIAGMFGGSTLSVFIADEDFTKRVLFNSKIDTFYSVEEKIILERYHGENKQWDNSNVLPTGLLSSAPPCLVSVGDTVRLIYRHNKGNLMYFAEYNDDGRFIRTRDGWIQGIEVHEAVGATVVRGKLCLVGRHADGDQMFSLLWDGVGELLPYSDHRRDGWHSPRFTWMGIDIQGTPSVATKGETVMTVARHYPGSAVMFSSMFENGERTKFGNTLLNTSFPPVIYAFNGNFFLIYTEVTTSHMVVATIVEGRWKPTKQLEKTSSGPAVTEYNGRMYLFHRDPSGNAIFYASSNDGINYTYDRRSMNFGLDGEGTPTACTMPGQNNGIMVAAILPVKKGEVYDIFTPYGDPEAIMYTIINPKADGTLEFEIEEV